MNKLIFKFFAVATALTLFAGQLSAQLTSGTVTLVESTGNYSVDVDYAVYDENDANNPLPESGQLTFVYELELSSSSVVNLESFSIAADDADVFSASVLDGDGTIAPSSTNVGDENVFWNFLTQDFVPGTTSELLIIQSAAGPNDTTITTSDGSLTATATVAGPVAPQTEYLPESTTDFFGGKGWDNGVPTSAFRAFIRSGGTAEADSGGPAEALELTVGDIVNGGDGGLSFDGVDLMVTRDLNISGDRTASVGSQTVSGSVMVQNTDLFEVNPAGASDPWDTYVGKAEAGTGQTIDSTGGLLLSNVTTVFIGNDLEAGEIQSDDDIYGDASVTTDAFIMVNGASNVTVGEDIELAHIQDGESSSGAILDATTALFVSNVSGTFSIGDDFELGQNEAGDREAFSSMSTTEAFSALNNIGSLTIADDFEVGVNNSGASSSVLSGDYSGTSASTAGVTISNVDSITVGDNFWVGRTSPATNSDNSTTFTGSVSTDASADISNVADLNVADLIEVGRSIVEDASGSLTGTVSTTGSLTMDNVVATLNTGGATRVGTLEDFSDTPSTAADMTVTGTLEMTASSLTTEILEIGTMTDGTLASASGTVTLNPSYISTDDLTLGDGGNVTFTLTGLNRVTASTVGESDTYAAIDATDALLEGTIVAAFDFTPEAGTHTFDLIISGGTTALDDTTMTSEDFQVSGLNAGFTVDSFGVVEDGNDIVRLQISGSPVLLGDVNLDGIVDLLDVAPFVDLLSDGLFQIEADINQDGVVNLLDIAPFVDLLSGS